MRTLVIGDIHGAFRCLTQVLQKAGPADRYMFLGDYVDGWPETPQVIEHIIGLGSSAICLRGNHDQWALEWLGRCEEMNNYFYPPEELHYTQGGRATYEAYMHLGEAKEKTMRRHLAWLKRLDTINVDGMGRVFVHGGFESSYMEPDRTLMWDRTLIQRAHRFKDMAQLPEPFYKYREIYVGHSATKYFTGEEKVENWLNLWAMDTNCGWGGPLCAMDIDTKECFYSDPARALYPYAQGRSK